MMNEAQLEAIKEASRQFKAGIALLTQGNDEGEDDLYYASFDLKDAGLDGEYVRERVAQTNEADVEDILDYLAELEG